MVARWIEKKNGLPKSKHVQQSILISGRKPESRVTWITSHLFPLVSNLSFTAVLERRASRRKSPSDLVL